MMSHYQYILDAVKTGFLEHHTYVRAFYEKTTYPIHTGDTKLFPLGNKGRLIEYMAVLVKGHSTREVLWVKIPTDDVWYDENDRDVPCFKTKNRFIFSEMPKHKMRKILLKRLIYQVEKHIDNISRKDSIIDQLEDLTCGPYKVYEVEESMSGVIILRWEDQYDKSSMVCGTAINCDMLSLYEADNVQEMAKISLKKYLPKHYGKLWVWKLEKIS